MILSLLFASMFVLAKIFHDRETIFYRSRWEYLQFGFGCFVLIYSANLIALWVKDVMR